MSGTDGRARAGRRQVPKALLAACMMSAAGTAQAATPRDPSFASLAAADGLPFGMEVTDDRGSAISPVIATALSRSAILTLNEYDRDTEWQSRRRVAMLNRLVRRGVPIGVLGIEEDIDPAKGRLDPTIVQSVIRAVASLGPDVFITELDVIDPTMPADVAARDATVAEQTRADLAAALAEPCVRLVTAGGVSDALNWMGGNPSTLRLDGLASRPYLDDDAFHPKPVRAAVAVAFRDASPRDGVR